MLLEKCEKFYHWIGVICVQPSVCTPDWFCEWISNIKKVWANFCVFLPHVWNELEKIRILGCFAVASQLHLPCEFGTRFRFAVLLNAVARGHFYAALVYNLMSRTFIVQREKPIHLFNNRSHFVQFVIHRMVTWYLHRLVTDTKEITNFWEPSKSENFTKTRIVHVWVCRKNMS